MLFADLINSAGLTTLRQVGQADIANVCCDSRQAKAGVCFVAVRGPNQDGHDHIGSAVKAGAAAVVCQDAARVPAGVAHAVVGDSAVAAGLLAQAILGWPSRRLTCIAVTGTKGKSTAAYMVRSILEHAGRPTGLLGTLVGTVKRTPDGPEALASTLRPVNQFGFRRSLENLVSVYRKAQRLGDLKEEFGGIVEVDGREALMLVRYLPPKEDYPSCKTITYIDLEYLVPVLIESYDWDQQPNSSYAFKDVRFNIGLGEKDFLPQSNEMKPPI